ncbi:cutinase domain protein [Metarhizium robertsii]|uniref:cutinase n=2 Tax=Metarhizium robertsii TaxID=568076 RepID=E9F3E9_METRA|nr:Cutinase, monofunctional [Metarhizium robertsii ARSEF 23]EFY97686.1 Cutinase, monofunctional [Metarhizium robertsii ARSEF 23]EXV05193.1 cutinase domain protein [Metarhizium robertsii]
MHFSKAVLAGLACSFAAGAPVSDVEYTAIEKRDLNLNAFLAAIVEIFPVNVPVNGICTALGIGETALAAAFGLKINANRRGCADVTVVFARGTCDPGNVGALVGPPFFRALEAAIGSSKSIAIQGVEYPATVDGYLRADPAAGVTMAKFITNTIAECPKTQFVLSGYSQGGYAVHNAAKNLDAKSMSKVKAVVIFGDPMSKEPVRGIDASRVSIVCHEGDDICDGGVFITPQHITYAEDAESSANFVVSKL